MVNTNQNQAGCGSIVLLVIGIGSLASFVSQSEHTRRPATLSTIEMPKLPTFDIPKAPVIDSSTWLPVTVTPMGGNESLSSPRPASTVFQTGGPGQSVVAFDNKTGETALVRLVGPTRQDITVPNGMQSAIRGVLPGRYCIRTRSGKPGGYRYSQGEFFDVEQTATQYSNIVITLHAVRNGNYGSHAIGAAEFGSVTQ